MRAISETQSVSEQADRLSAFLKFLGLCISIVPIIGAIFYVAFRKKPSGYGEKCGVMALLGVVLYAVIRAGGDMV